MAREGLRYELTAGLRTAVHQTGAVTLKDLKVTTDAGVQTVNITIQAIQEPEQLCGTAMVIFTDVPTPPETTPPMEDRQSIVGNSKLARLERELRHAREELHTMREQMQTAQEELKAANEELQSMNEDLQSTNEELTTSKEELQSTNEELQTVNTELQIRVNDLSRANDDMKNLLNSTDLATIFLDDRLRLRRFTTQATKIFRLIEGDHGRLLSDIVSDLDYPGLAADARQVLQTLVFSEKEIVASDGRWFRARIMPYRTLEDRIDGLVITFVDVTTAKKLEADLRAAQLTMEQRATEQSNELAQARERLKTQSDAKSEKSMDEGIPGTTIAP
jgi:two-component system CheB/CheR fusion protein